MSIGNIRKNPTHDFQDRTSRGNYEEFLKVEKKPKPADLVEMWKKSRRAFAIILNEFGDCSTVSVRKIQPWRKI